MTKTAHLLLITNSQGSVEAVRFPSLEAARAWEDQHEMEIGDVVGVVPVVTKADVLRG